MADPKQVKVFDGTNWVDLKAEDPTLPISSTDGTVVLSDSSGSFVVSTGGTESFKIASNKYATFQGHIGIMSAAYSTAALALQGEVEPANAGGAFGLWVSPTYVVDPDATYAKHARAFASAKAPVNGQAFDTFTHFYAAVVCGSDVKQNFGVYVAAAGAINNIGCCVTGGGVVKDGNWGFYDNTNYLSYFQGGVQTPSVSGIVDNDASVALGGSFVVSTGNPSQARLTVRPDGNIGHGYVGQANINFCSYNKFGISTIEEIGFMSAPRFDGQPSYLCASIQSQPEFTDVVANNVVHFMAKDDRAGNKSFAGKHVGFLSSDLDKSTVLNIGFESAEAGEDNFAFLASGTSPSRFNGGVKTPSVRGIDDNAASVTLDSNFVARAETGTAELNSNKNGWNNRFIVSNNTFTYNTGVVNQEHNKYVQESDGTSTQVVKEGVYGLTTTVNDWGAQAGHTLFRNLVGPHVIQAEESIRAITQSPNNDPNVTDPTAGIFLASSGAAGQYAQFSTSQSEVRCENTTVQLKTQASPNSSKRTRFTVADTVITSEVNIKSPSISGLSGTDASVTLGGQATLKAGDGSAYVPIDENSLTTKKYCDDEISQAIASNTGDTTLGAGTPTSETEPDDSPGSMLFDENYLWLKTNTVWKKIPLAGFNAPAATATVQVSQAQYNALSPKDPNTLYIIVG